MKQNLACVLKGHEPLPPGKVYFADGKFRDVCLYCEEVIHYVGDIGSYPSLSWKTKEEMDKTNDRPTGFDPDYD
jgi:hypothetical protein